MREPLLASLLILLVVCGLAIWTYRGLLMSLTVRFLASRLPNAAKRHGLSIGFANHDGTWIRLTLQADLGKTLSEVVGYPLEAAAYSRFAGFNLNRLYSDFMNPDSLHYQCWLGAYVVFDNQYRRAFGFDERGEPVDGEAVAVLEADQRLVYRSAGCPHRFPGDNTVRLRGQLNTERVEEDGGAWRSVSGEADTWSAYHRGANPSGGRLRRRVYGVVPNSATHDVDDFHPLRYQGEFWMRYFPQYKATCAKFYIRPLYTDRHGNEVRKGYHVAREYRKLLRGITFTMGSQS